MAYDLNLYGAALRHFEDGAALSEKKRFDNAGYHFGFAAECAVKCNLKMLGVRDDEKVQWTHLPEMKLLALQTLSGRSAATLRTVLERGNFMQQWDVRMRYASSGTIDEDTVKRWRDHANEVIGCLL